jgi:hypothetical protein
MDTIKDHYSVSIFKDYNPYFWCPNVSWKNKYIDNDPSKGHRFFYLMYFKVNYPDYLTDAWHIGKILREGCNILAILIALLFTQHLPIQSIVVFLLLISFLRNWCFNLFYNKIFIK